MRGIITTARRVPALFITVISVVPITLLWSKRLWTTTLPLGFSRPSLGQWVVIALAAYTVVNALVGMVEDIRHGRPGVDILAVVAVLATLAVQEYWASWAVVLMVWSGEAIEGFARSKAGSNLNALVSAAPHEAHVVASPDAAEVVESAPETQPSATSSTGSTLPRATPYRHTLKPDDRHGESAYDVSDSAHAVSRRHWRTVSADAVDIGDVLMVLPGETVPVDGELLSGAATLDLSAINGEPLPRTVYAGVKMMSGAVNGPGAITMRATSLAKDSQYQHILDLVSSARDSRAPIVKTADLLAIPFTVLALMIASVAWLLSGDSTRFAQVLVLATPCPLLIAAPVAYLAGTGRLAKAGVLIKTQEVIENLARTTHVFFDKTGTLTAKKLHVLRVDLAGVHGELGAGFDKDHVLVLAGLVEGYSVHILARGIASAGEVASRRLHAERGGAIVSPAISAIDEDPGNGICGKVDGLEVRVGRFDYVMADRADDSRNDRRGYTRGDDVARYFPSERCRPIAPDEMTAYVTINGCLAARIVLRDTPRENAKATVDDLRAQGIARLTMVTGDRDASAQAIASEVGIDDVRSDMLPQDKLSALEAERHHGSVSAGGRRADAGRQVVMMVGDGVNDAPVLAAADIGVAITDGTTTAAAQSAHMVVMDDDLYTVARAIRIARHTRRVMLQAVAIGLGLAVVGMVAAAWNLIPVVVGAFLQEAVDVVSILWALTALTGHDASPFR